MVRSHVRTDSYLRALVVALLGAHLDALGALHGQSGEFVRHRGVYVDTGRRATALPMVQEEAWRYDWIKRGSFWCLRRSESLALTVKVEVLGPRGEAFNSTSGSSRTCYLLVSKVGDNPSRPTISLPHCTRLIVRRSLFHIVPSSDALSSQTPRSKT